MTPGARRDDLSTRHSVSLPPSPLLKPTSSAYNLKMGKGAGLCISTPRQADAQQVEVKPPAGTTAQPAPAKPEPATVPVAASAPKLNDIKMTANKKIAIVFCECPS